MKESTGLVLVMVFYNIFSIVLLDLTGRLIAIFIAALLTPIACLIVERLVKGRKA